MPLISSEINTQWCPLSSLERAHPLTFFHYPDFFIKPSSWLLKYLLASDLLSLSSSRFHPLNSHPHNGC